MRFRKLKPQIKLSIVIICIMLIPILLNNQLSLDNTSAHSSISNPMEIFSLWNDTIPLIDGYIDFNSSKASEWSTAAVYNLYDASQTPSSKLLLKNDDTNLFVGIDAISFTTEFPTASWGMGIYLDRNHNGLLDQIDRAIYFKSNSTDDLVIIYQYNLINNKWVEIETGLLGDNLTTSNVILDSDFRDSFFEAGSHRQYEIVIPLSLMQTSPGKITGIAFETFENLAGFNEENTWPYIDTTLSDIRTKAELWGDIFIGKNSGDFYTKYSIEDNFNIKDSAIGPNNGTFLKTADIDGNGDLELVVSSNRTVSSDNNLLAIYDTIDGELVKIWSSWFTTHQTKMFNIKQLVAYDFDENGQEELFLVGEDSRILRLTNWDSESNDFIKSDYVYTHTSSLTGYIALGYATNLGNMNIAFGDQNGRITILDYDNSTGGFTQDKRSPIVPFVAGFTVEKVHAIEIADVDTDGKNEILVNLQITSDDSLSTTRLQIYERAVAKYLENPEDDLPASSSILTEDNFGHTILVADVDNDLATEIVLVGQNYLRILSANSLQDPSPHLEFIINDAVNSPFMGGGALVADVDNDLKNELVFACNNGTLFVINITDSGGNTLSYEIEWSGDIGSSPGKRKSIIAYDLDDDTETEIIFGDNFGQIMTLGKTIAPEITIISPSSGSSTSSTSIIVTWEGTDDFAIHHYDVIVEGLIQGRVNGSQTSLVVSLPSASNTITVICYDVNGKSDSDSIIVSQSTTSPEIYITSPENYFLTDNNEVTVEFDHFDPNGDFNHYEIWVDEGRVGGDYDKLTTSVVVTLSTDGEHNITIVGVDDASNKGRSSIFVTVDTTAPLLTITYPKDNSAIKLTTVELQWSASDALSGLSNFVIEKDDEFYATTTEYSQTIVLDSDKTYKLDVTAYDILGNSKTDTISIIKDSVAPKVTITNPENEYKSTSTLLKIDWDAEDNIGGIGIHHTEVIVNQQTVYSGTATTTTFNVEEGIKDIIVNTLDIAGNIATDYITVYVDNSVPYLEILTPETGYITGLDQFILSWYCNDTGSGISEFKIYVDNILTETIDDPLIRSAIVPLALDSTSTIILNAIDNSGFSVNKSISVTQDLSLPSISFLNPQENLSYISNTLIPIEWDAANIEDFIRYSIYINNTEIHNVTNIATMDYIVDLGTIPIDEFPLYNFTIVVEALSYNISDTKWILIDQSTPTIQIITPENNTAYYQEIVYLQWSANDLGSSVQKYRLLINGEYISDCLCIKNYYYLRFNSNGEHIITVQVFDFALNVARSNVTLIMNVLMPEYAANIPTNYITPDGIFRFDFTITDAKAGVKGLFFILDDVVIMAENYEDNIQYDPFTVSFEFNETIYTALDASHELEVAILEYYNREMIQLYIISIDTETPTILPSITVDSELLSAEGLVITNGSKENIFFSVTVTDNFGINRVTLTVSNGEMSETFEMDLEQADRIEVSVFTLNLSLHNFGIGEYSLVFTAYDFAGNSHNLTYNLVVSPAITIPWLKQGNNTIYLSAGIVGFVLISTLVAVAARASAANKDWKEEIISVIYVKKTGLTCVNVQYAKQLIQEEQLIGGAMVAIQSMLNELSFQKKSARITDLELGDKTLFLLFGDHGISVLLVNDVKPIHKKLLVNFNKKFEKKFKIALENLYFVDNTSFMGSEELVESIFGPIKDRTIKAGITDQLQEIIEDIKPAMEEKDLPIKIDESLLENETPIDSLIKQLSREAKRSLIKIIKNTPAIIIDLAEQNLNDTEIKLQTINIDLELLRKIERSNFEMQLFIENMLTLVNEIRNGIQAGRQNDMNRLKLAIETATRIWFDDIAEKWSDI